MGLKARNREIETGRLISKEVHTTGAGARMAGTGVTTLAVLTTATRVVGPGSSTG